VNESVGFASPGDRQTICKKKKNAAAIFEQTKVNDCNFRGFTNVFSRRAKHLELNFVIRKTFP